MAEEAKNPPRDIAIGFGSAIATLVVLAGAVMVCGIGVDGWERIVYEAKDLTGTPGQFVIAVGAKQSDSPFPMVLGQIVKSDHPLWHLLISIGGLRLIASLNGIILVAGRAISEMGRAGFLPVWLGTTSPRTHTPAAALWLNFVIGVLSILFANTGKLITLSALGAVMLYVLSMQAVVNLRRLEPDLPRPFRVPCYPLFPLTAQALSAFVLVMVLVLNFDMKSPLQSVSVWYAFVLLGSLAYYGIRPR